MIAHKRRKVKERKERNEERTQENSKSLSNQMGFKWFSEPGEQQQSFALVSIPKRCFRQLPDSI